VETALPSPKFQRNVGVAVQPVASTIAWKRTWAFGCAVAGTVAEQLTVQVWAERFEFPSGSWEEPVAAIAAVCWGVVEGRESLATFPPCFAGTVDQRPPRSPNQAEAFDNPVKLTAAAKQKRSVRRRELLSRRSPLAAKIRVSRDIDINS
jgi:hypothetical protein